MRNGTMHLSTDLKTRARYGARRRTLALLAACVASAVLPGACAPKPKAAPAAAELKIGDQRGNLHALMAAAGVLNDTPYKLQFVDMPAAAPLLEALSAGAIDLGAVGGEPFAFAYANGAPIKAALASRLVTVTPDLARSSAIIVRKDSPIRRVADLRGRKIATIKGSAGHDFILRVLEREHIDPKSVRFVFLSNGDAKAALASGDIDAWSTWASYVGIAVEENGDRVLVDATGLIGPGRVSGFVAVSDKAIETKQPQLRDFLRRLTLARAWAKTHRDAYAAEVAKETGVPVSVARYSAAYVLASEYTPIDAEVQAQQRATLERYRAAGVIDVLPNLDATAYATGFDDIIPAPSVRQAAN